MDLSTIQGDISSVIATGKAALPAVQAVLGVVSMIDPALAADVAIANKVIAFVGTIENIAPNLPANLTAIQQDFTALAAAYKAATA